MRRVPKLRRVGSWTAGPPISVHVSLNRCAFSSTVDEKAQRFRLTWTEIGGPAVQEPTRRSFGTRLINRLAEQLQGNVRLRYEPTGVVYELDVSLAVLRGSAIDK